MTTKQTLKILTSLLIFAGFFSATSAEETTTPVRQEIKGRVTNMLNDPMPYVTITMLDKDSALIDGTITDENGEYSLTGSTEPYLLQASYVGYQSVWGGPNFVLNEASEQLAEVNVKARRPIVERKMDKLVLNVADSPFALGNSAKDLLKKAPGVNIDKDGKVTVNGKSVQVYIDDRPSNLSGEQLRAMLEGTDGSTIEKIEIISNPSAKYDAAGQGGIINIKTKRNMMKGFNGSLMASYAGMYDGKYKNYKQFDYAGVNLNYRTEKTYSYLQFGQIYFDPYSVEESGTRILSASGADTIAEERYSTGTQKIKYRMYNTSVGNDWFIDKKNTLGFIFRVPLTRMNQSMPEAISVSSLVRTTPAGTDTLENSNNGSNTQMNWNRYYANVNYTHVFNDSIEQELTVNIDYAHNNSSSLQSESNRYHLSSFPDSILLLSLDSRERTNIYSAKLDFQTQFWRTGMIEAGVKWALSSIDYHQKTDSTVNSVALQPTIYDFGYSEHIAAGYITAAKQFGKHWNLKLGLRGEYTYSMGNWITADSVTRNSYFNLFPTFFGGYNPTDKWGLSLSYTRRIERPNSWQLNPFVQYIDAHTYRAGNPYLKPQFTHAIELQANYSQYVYMSLNYDHTTNLFTREKNILPNGDQFMYDVNMGRRMAMGVQLGLTEIPIVPKYTVREDGSREMDGAWLALTLNGAYYYNIQQTEDRSYQNASHSGYIYAELNSYLPRDWTLSAKSSWSSPSVHGYSRHTGYYGLSLVVQKRFPKQGLTLNLHMDDLVYSAIWESRTINLPPGNYAYMRSYENSRNISVSIQWIFGTQQYTKTRNVGNLDESSRFGSSGNSGSGK